MNCPANLWANRDYSATTIPPAPGPQAPLNERAFVTASTLKVRAGAGAENAIVGRLSRGAEVTIVERVGEWARLAPTNSGESNWVASSFLSAEAPPA